MSINSIQLHDMAMGCRIGVSILRLHHLSLIPTGNIQLLFQLLSYTSIPNKEHCQSKLLKRQHHTLLVGTDDRSLRIFLLKTLKKVTAIQGLL